MRRMPDGDSDGDYDDDYERATDGGEELRNNGEE